MANLIDQFSTFYQVNSHRRQVKDSRLTQNLHRLLQQYPELNDETALLRYFCEAAENNSDSLALCHLLAYVDSACYSVAIATYQIFRTPGLTWVDYLQIARDKIATCVIKLCAKYEPSQSQTKTYFYWFLRHAIVSEVRQSQEVERRSDWWLLQNSSKKARKTALEKMGIKDTKLSNCLLAWQGFSEVYAPVATGRNQKLPSPTEEQWEAIAQFCNEQHLPQSVKTFTVQEIQALLKICVNALREPSKIKLYSLNEDNRDLELETTNKSEQQVWYRDQETAESEQHQQVKTELASAIASLPADARKMLILEHGFIGFNQSYIGQEFGIPQYKVSRYLTRDKRHLLEVLVQWSQRQTGVILNVETVNHASIHLDEWLIWYCQNAILYRFLETVLRLHPALKLEIKLLYRYYGMSLPGKADESAIACEFNLTQAELQEKLVKAKTILQQQLHQWLQQILALKTCSLNAINNSSALLVEQFLANAPYALLIMERR